MDNYKDLSERQRLELAAKAAGLETKWDQPRGAKTGWLRIKSGSSWPVWDPVDDDAENYRLSVQLDIQIEHIGKSNGPTFEVNCWPRGRGDCAACHRYKSDKQAATRHAVFEAAVRLGLSMLAKEQEANAAADAQSGAGNVKPSARNGAPQ